MVGCSALFFLHPSINSLFNSNTTLYALNNNNCIAHFSENQPDVNLTITKTLKLQIPLVFGSSELSSNHLKSICYHFFKEKNIAVQTIGHAGFQCFAISSVLATNAEFLKNSKILIILSPGWFEGKYAKGTELPCFFEYNNQFSLSKHYESKYIPTDYQLYFTNYLNRKYSQINSPNALINLLAHRGNIKYSLFNKVNELIYDYTKASHPEYKRLEYIEQDLVSSSSNKYEFNKPILNWDSLNNSAINEFKKLSTNNDLGIENSYYDFWVKSKPLKQIQIPSHNQEFEDLKALLNLCHQLKCKPIFTIMPINPLVYENAKGLVPVITNIKAELDKYQFHYLDMFTPNVTNYKKGVLEDIMHPGEYGWLQINQFLINEFGK